VGPLPFDTTSPRGRAILEITNRQKKVILARRWCAPRSAAEIALHYLARGYFEEAKQVVSSARAQQQFRGGDNPGTAWQWSENCC
jgi:hypothetical protein